MSLNSTPNADRIHIGIFGRRNAGKSSIINAITGQELAIVSDIEGTTTDPVSKAMELLPLGAVVIIDTPGLDDSGVLGEMRHLADKIFRHPEWDRKRSKNRVDPIRQRRALLRRFYGTE